MNNTGGASIARTTDFESRAVCVSACDRYDLTLLDDIIEQHCVRLGLDNLIFDGATVVIKPNLVIRRRPDEATTTHPDVVAAVIRAARRRGAGRVIVAESSGGPYTKAAMNLIFSGCGITEVCEREGAELNTDFGISTVDHPDAILCHQFSLINPIVQADVLINIAKLKTHSMTGLSGAVKNLFGCVPGLTKPEMHCQYPDKSQFQQMIVDLCTLVRPTVSFVDAIDCMEGDGPTGGSKRFVGAVLSGLNPFAVDIAVCHLIAVDPDSIFMLRHGMAQGISPTSLSELELWGDDPDTLRVHDFVQPKSKRADFLDFLPAFMRPVAERAERIIAPRPEIVAKKCVGCGKCAESCPQHTIAIVDRRGGKKRASIDYSTCIRCYCCHEMCPIRAIDIKRTFIWRL